MNNDDLISFGYAFAGLSSGVREQIERIIRAGNELPDDLLEELCVEDLRRAIEELSCCNVPRLVRTIDSALTQVVDYQGAA